MPVNGRKEPMRKKFSRSLVILTAVLLCLSTVAETLPALADNYATYGTATADTTFYVTSAGVSTLVLSQSGPGWLQKQYVYNTANTTNEQAYAQYTVLYKGTMDAYWQQAAYWNGKTCTLNFYRADVYTVRVLPVAVQSMQTDSTLWRYTQWITVPAWYVSGVQNCAISSTVPQYAPTPTRTPKPTATPTPKPLKASVTVLYRDIDGNYLASDVRSLSVGSHTVKPTRTFPGYTLVGSASYRITVNANGIASEQMVTFWYQLKVVTPTPTKKPTATAKPQFAYVVYYYDINNNYMGQDTIYLTPGTHNIKPRRSFNNYVLVSAETVRVQVSKNGVVTPGSVTFVYEPYIPTVKPTRKPTKKPTPTPKPTKRPTSRPPRGKVVLPIDYTTLFRPGYSAHQNKEQDLYKLFDDDRTTVFSWTYWTSESWDSTPGTNEEANFTVYFGEGATVGAVGFRNGNCKNATAYKENSRAYRWRVRVWTDNGKHYDTIISLTDTFSTDYQVYNLKSVYKNVNRIQFYMIKDRKKPGSKNKNNLCISDLQFYTGT